MGAHPHEQPAGPEEQVVRHLRREDGGNRAYFKFFSDFRNYLTVLNEFKMRWQAVRSS